MTKVRVENCCALAFLRYKPVSWKWKVEQLWGCCSCCWRTEFPNCLYSRENAKILRSFSHPIFVASLLPDTSCAKQIMMKLRLWIEVFKRHLPWFVERLRAAQHLKIPIDFISLNFTLRCCTERKYLQFNSLLSWISLIKISLLLVSCFWFCCLDSIYCKLTFIGHSSIVSV